MFLTSQRMVLKRVFPSHTHLWTEMGNTFATEAKSTSRPADVQAQSQLPRAVVGLQVPQAHAHIVTDTCCDASQE